MNPRWMAFLVLFLVVFFQSATPLLAEQTIKISSDPWEPWVLGEEGGLATGGTAVRLAEEVFRQLKVPVEIKIYPYERCMRQMQSGERDVLLMAKKTKEREKFMLFSDVAASDPQQLYFAVDRLAGFQWNNWEDLKKYTIGGVSAFNYGGLEDAVKKHNLKVIRVENDFQNLRKLVAGRIDLIILNKSTAKFFEKKYPKFRGKFIAAKKPIANADFHFALSKKGNAVSHLPGINKVLKKMKADGSLEKVLGFAD